MFIVPQKKFFVPFIIIVALLSAGLMGCGESQGVTTLTAWLSDFSQLIEDYKGSIGSDQSKQAELDAKITTMTAKWVDMRNEFGAEVTPQQMEKMVRQYESLMSTLKEVKNSIGS